MNNLSTLFIRKPVMTILLTVAVLVFGVLAYFQLPVSDLPSVDYPVMTISVGYPGASPSLMASAVAAPLESECMAIPGLKSVISNNTEGSTQITLTFELDRNVDLAAPDVQAAIARAQGNLPGDLPSPPVYSKDNPSESPIMYLSLSSDTITPGELYDFASRDVAKRVSMIEGVSKTQIHGAKSAIRIQVNPEVLSALGIGFDEVAKTIKASSVLIPGGSLDGDTRTFSIEPQGQLMKAADWKKVVVAYRNGSPVRLGAIANCIDSLNDDQIRIMFGEAGKPPTAGGCLVAISRTAGANTVALSERIREALKTIRTEIPASITLGIMHDKSESIVESVQDVKFTIFVALGLVVFVVFLFIGRVTDTMIPAVALPLSIIATFFVMYGLGFSLDNLSLMGLTLAVGFLVDDAIVELENAVRLIEKGKRPFEAAIDSAIEIAGTVMSMTLALITVFVPIVFMPGVVGRNFKEFALTVIVAVACSCVISRTLTPMMCSRMLRSQTKKTALQVAADSIEHVLLGGYGGALRWVLRHRFVSLVVWGICIVGTVWAFTVLPKTLLPPGDSGFIRGAMMSPQGTSSSVMQKFQDDVDAALDADPAVQRYCTVTGASPGADQSTGYVFAFLKPVAERPPIEAVLSRLNTKWDRLAYGKVYAMPNPKLKISTGGEATALGSKYSFSLRGQDIDQVNDCAQKIEARLRAIKGFEGLQSSVKLDMPQLRIHIKRDRAATLGITVADIENVLALAYTGGRVTTYKTDVDQYDIILEVEDEFYMRPANLARIYLRSPVSSELIPLSVVTDMQEAIGPQAVPHDNQLNAATISFSLSPDMPISKAVSELNTVVREVVPPEIAGEFRGEAQEFQEAVYYLAILMAIAIFLMYVILGVLYESYIHPFTVLTTLPVAAFGGLMTLVIFRSELSLYSYIGLFMLTGIVAKNGIMMVEFAIQRLDRPGTTYYDAIYDACMTRFRPIVMTGVAAIMGAVPIAIGFGADGAARRPLGLIVVGGLMFSQVITLFVTPAIYLYMQQFQEKVLDRFEITRSDAARERMEAGRDGHTDTPAA